MDLQRLVAPNDFGEQYGDSEDNLFVMVIVGSQGYVNVHGISQMEALRARQKGIQVLTSDRARGIIARGKAAK